MARTAFTAEVIGSGATYTVPAGKIAVFCARINTAGSGDFTLKINGVSAGAFNAGAQYLEMRPLCANAGDVVSVASTGPGLGLNGFLYDA